MGAIWDEFEHDPRDPVHAPLRAADKDRDVVRRVLGEAYAEGRLDREELDERTDVVMETRTLGELPALITDLIPVAPTKPTTTSPAVRRDRAVQSWRKDRKEALWTFLSVSVLCWVIWGVTSLGGDGFNPYFPWPLFPTLAVGFHFGRIAIMRDEIIEEKQRSLEKKERKAIERQRRELNPPDES